MRKEKEIEFKTELRKDEYISLINKYNLNNSIYEITNHYFDTPYHSFKKSYKTLRIRYNASYCTYTLTFKSKISKGVLEKHYKLDEDIALKYINNGFNLKEYYDIDVFVKPFGSLHTKRVTMPYLDGTLFFDEFSYFDQTKYEVEYEVKDYDKGFKDFNEFLSNEDLKFIKTPKKSARFFSSLNK